MAVLIDASILIEAERGRLQLESHVARRQDDEAFLSVITASELLHGVHRALERRLIAVSPCRCGRHPCCVWRLPLR